MPITPSTESVFTIAPPEAKAVRLPYSGGKATEGPLTHREASDAPLCSPFEQ
ncbi:MAG: hypothetical protein K8I30_20845 [Anaerolineae bacterium]|nr:hypothetical protein [Anaerolineae bacterium]